MAKEEKNIEVNENEKSVNLKRDLIVEEPKKQKAAEGKQEEPKSVPQINELGDQNKKQDEVKEKEDPKKLEDFRTMGEPSKAQKPEKKVSESAVSKVKEKSKDKKGEVKSSLERIYVVPLRKGFMKVPRHKRAKKAVKTLKEFLAKHMKVENRDISKVKVDIYLNNEIWFRGIKRPTNKIKVRAKKVEGIVYAELFDIPEVVRFKKQRDEKKGKKVDKGKLEKVVASEAAEEKKRLGREDKENKTLEKEKEASVAEAGAKFNKKLATAEKHTAKVVSSKMDKMSETSKRKALKK